MSEGVTIGERIEERWDSLVKPPGSLGALEDIVVRVGEIQGTAQPEIQPASLLLFAGDHGVTEENVSAYPSSVTASMLEVIRDGGAAINSLCETAGLDLKWYNVGANTELSRDHEKLDHGTSNMVSERAMTEEQVNSALDIGRRCLRIALEDESKLVALGEVGIGNTTASSAIAGAILDEDLEDLVGPGTGVEGERLEHKKEVIREALEKHSPDPSDGRDVLETVGGFEIAAQVGAILEAYERDVPVFLDGFITGAAALAASRIESSVTRVLLASHSSSEPAHDRILDELNLQPMVDFNLHLGEGSGAAVCYSILKSAVTVYRKMDTFEEAGLNGHNS